jgi:predicted SnoaL-like aldol condensation-catalyzing enzyme
LVPTGREGFISYFKQKGRPPRPVRAELAEPPVVVITQGDLVMLMWKSMRPEPADDAKSYESFWFDLFRVKDGWIVEHWDNATK